MPAGHSRTRAMNQLVPLNSPMLPALVAAAGGRAGMRPIREACSEWSTGRAVRGVSVGSTNERIRETPRVRRPPAQYGQKGGAARSAGTRLSSPTGSSGLPRLQKVIVLKPSILLALIFSTASGSLMWQLKACRNGDNFRSFLSKFLPIFAQRHLVNRP
jgi:hypothetical protein